MRSAHWTVWSLAALVLTVAVGPAIDPAQAGGSSRSIHYTLPAGAALGMLVVGGDVGFDPCALPCVFGPGEHSVGNPMAAIDGPVTDLIVQMSDDHYGQLGASALCLSNDADGTCDDDDTWLGSHCGPYILPGTTTVAQVLVIGLAYRNQAGETCGATDGILTLQWT